MGRYLYDLDIMSMKIAPYSSNAADGRHSRHECIYTVVMLQRTGTETMVLGVRAMNGDEVMALELNGALILRRKVLCPRMLTILMT